MNRSFKKEVWQAILRTQIGACMQPPLKRAYARFILKKYLPIIEPLCDEPANFENIIKAAYAYHRLMRDSGLLKEFTDRYDGPLIGGSKEDHLECLTRIANDNLKVLNLALDDSAGYLKQRNMTELEALSEFRVFGQDAEDAIAGKLTIGRMLATRPQIILTTFWSFFTFGSRIKPQ